MFPLHFRYQTTVKRWLSGNIDRKSYSQRIRRLLSASEYEHHNEYVLSIIKTSLQKEPDLESITKIYKVIDTPEAKDPTKSSSTAASTTTAKPISKSKVLPEKPAPAPVVSRLPSTKTRSSKKRYEEDEEDFTVITKRKRRKLIVSDEDEDEEEPPKKTNKAETPNKANHVIKRPTSHEVEENDCSNLNKSKRKRKMVILSDDEDVDISSLLSSRSSVPSVFDDPKTTINVKSTGLLKTTLTIKRNDDTADAKAANSIISKPAVSVQPVPKPILPVSKPVAEPVVSNSTSIAISKPKSKKPSKSVKISATDSSKISTKEALRKASKKRIAKLVKKLDSNKSLLSDPIHRKKYPSSLLDRLLSSDKKALSQPSTSTSGQAISTGKFYLQTLLTVVLTKCLFFKNSDK